MSEIKKLREYDGFYLSAVSFRWQGMTIWLVKILGYEGKTYLNVKPEGAIGAGLITDFNTARWTISLAAEPKPAAGASITSNGSVPSVTAPSTTGSPAGVVGGETSDF